MKRVAWRWCAGLLALLLLLAAVPSPARAEPDQQAILAELFTLNRSLEESRAAMAELDRQIGLNDRELASAAAEGARLTARRQEVQLQFGRRVRYLSERGRFAPFGFLIGASSLIDFLDRVELVQLILQRDAELMAELRSLNAAVAAHERALGEQRERLDSLREEQREKERGLQAAIAQKEALLAGLKEERGAVEAKLAEVERLWTGSARPVLEGLVLSLQGVDMGSFRPDATELTLFPLGAVVRISEQNLNRFFGSQADLKGIAFRIRPGTINLEGEYGGAPLQVAGAFAVADGRKLRYEPKEIRVHDFTVPEAITREILAESPLEIDLTELITFGSLREVRMEEGFLVLRIR